MSDERYITLTKKGEFVLPRVVELVEQGVPAAKAFDQADREWEERNAQKH